MNLKCCASYNMNPAHGREDPVQVASVMGMSVSLDLLVDMYPIPTTREALERDLIDLEAARFLKATEVPGTWMITQVLRFVHMHTRLDRSSTTVY